MPRRHHGPPPGEHGPRGGRDLRLNPYESMQPEVTPLSFAVLASESASSENFASFDVPLWMWVAFLGCRQRPARRRPAARPPPAHVISSKEAAIESAVWIAIGLSFTGVIWGGTAAGGRRVHLRLPDREGLTVDNVFVWALILAFFAVPRAYQFRVLFWGIFGALVLRSVFIFAGVAAHRAVRVAALRVRRVPAVHGLPDRPRRRGRGPPREQPGAEAGRARSSRRPTSTTARRCSPGATASGWRRRCSPC